MAAHRAPRTRRGRRVILFPFCLARSTVAVVLSVTWVALCAFLLLLSLCARAHGAQLRSFVRDDMLSPLLASMGSQPSEPVTEHVTDPDPSLWPPMGTLDTDTPDEDEDEDEPITLRAMRRLQPIG
jgi:hypothetical protein